MKKIKALLINDTRIDCHHGCERVVQGIHTLCEQSSISIVRTFPSHSFLLTNKSYIDAIDDCDLLLINGEGTMHGARRFAVELLEAGLYAKSKGKKVALLNSCWINNTQEMAEMVACFDFIVVRDNQSAEELRSQGVDCFQSFDLSLYSPVSINKVPIYPVGISDSVLPRVTEKLYFFAAKNKFKLISIQFPSTDNIHGYYRFMRNVVSFRNYRDFPSLPSVLFRRYKLLTSSTRVTSDWVKELAEYKVIVSGRFHLCTLAALAETPFIAINSNTSKIKNFIEDAGLDIRRLVAIENLENIELLEYRYSKAELASLREYICRGRVQYDDIFKEIYRAVVAC